MPQTVLTDVYYKNLHLHPLLQQGLAEAGFIRCTPIQALTLPVALAGRDIAGQAQTGTGKTCAFLVTLMNRLLTTASVQGRKKADPRALVIAPTRELAIQIGKDAQALGQYTGLRTALIYGGVDYDKQRQQFQSDCDIIIATPGRLLDYYRQHLFALASVEVMVIDEADRMFDLGFIKDVRFILRRLPPREQRQVLLFSATLSHRVLELAYEHMHQAEKLVVESEHVTADRVRQLVYFPAKEEKLPLLLHLLQRTPSERSIVFVNTKVAAEYVAGHLQRYGYRVGALSGDVPQVKRQKLLQRFQEGQLAMLVCTDVAARGLHIPAVSHVFNYDLPQDAEDYVHRIGRTARLGAEGDAISFACDRYALSLPDIEHYIGQRIPVGVIEPSWLMMPKPPPMQAKPSLGTDQPATVDAAPVRQGRGYRSRHRGERAASGRPAARVAESASAPVVPPTGAQGGTMKKRREGAPHRRPEALPLDVMAARPEGHDAMAKPPRDASHGAPRRTSRPLTPQTAAAPAAAPMLKMGLLRRLARIFTGR